MENFEQLLNKYRNYFLDPSGFNLKEFLHYSNKMLTKILKMYTKRDVQVEISLVGEQTAEINIHDRTDSSTIKKKIFDTAFKMPEEGHSLDELVDTLGDLLQSEVCFNTKFLGQMHPHDSIPSFVAGITAKFLNGNTVAEEVSRVTTYLEKQAVGWLAEACGYNPDLTWLSDIKLEGKFKEVLDKMIKLPSSSGNITCGGTTANFAALLVARNKAFMEDIYWKKEGVAEAGLTKKEDCVVFGSEYSHYSIEKLCGYAGIGSKKFIKVNTTDKKVDARDTRPGSLKQMMWQAAREGKKVVGVIAVAGTTETGNIDDLEGIANLLDEFENEFEYRPHFHVDAAHGGGFAFHDSYNPRKNGLLKGIDRADSITVDPHKMLYTHYSAGCILFKNKQDHYLLKQTADYLFKNDGSCNLGQFRVEGSMGLEGAIQTWASLFCLGKKGYQTIHQHVLNLTKYLEEKIKATNYLEVLHKREMNILCFRYYNSEFSEEVNNEINKEAQKRMYDTGKAYISNENQLHTVAGEKKKIEVFRAIPMHPWTKKEDIDFAFEEVNNAICSTLSDREKYFQKSIASIKNGGA